jgi:hypothetical protein
LKNAMCLLRVFSFPLSLITRMMPWSFREEVYVKRHMKLKRYKNSPGREDPDRR